MSRRVCRLFGLRLGLPPHLRLRLRLLVGFSSRPVSLRPNPNLRRHRRLMIRESLNRVRLRLHLSQLQSFLARMSRRVSLRPNPNLRRRRRLIRRGSLIRARLSLFG